MTAGETPAPLKEQRSDYQSRLPIPLWVAVNEEGGMVNRVSIRESVVRIIQWKMGLGLL